MEDWAGVGGALVLSQEKRRKYLQTFWRLIAWELDLNSFRFPGIITLRSEKG